ncbi:MAG: VanZ family protein [Planococcus sp. (in: firmicutes)]|nr:VanZ family protein [Planococcus sp. (in: firmicutes)]
MKKQLLAWLWPALWMVLIFMLSHQPAGVSGGISSEIVQQVFEAVASFIPVEFETLHTLFRKSAHFLAYLVLGILFAQALEKNGMALGRAALWAFALSALYAASDEFHQLFIPGRSGEIRDVLIDSAGAATGLVCYWLFAKSKWQHDKKAETNW